MDLIIGAGATGLTYAAYSKNPYHILEKENSIGGYCKTIKQDGFVWDYSGHFFHFQNPDFEKFICEYIDKRSIIKCHKHTQIKYKDLYVDFPFQKNIHQLPKDELIDCLYDLFCNTYHNYTNFKEMLYCKFGKSISEKFLIPYNEKLYACDLNKLDSDAMGRFFPYADKEEIVANFKSHYDKSYNEYFTYPIGGAIEYINSLKHRIPDSAISLNTQVKEIDIKKKIVYTDYDKFKYENLISTIPFPQLLELCNIDYDDDIYSWNQVLVFNIGFNTKGKDKINNWVYFPDKEISFYRVGYYDNIFNDDRMSIYVEIGFPKNDLIDVEKYYCKAISDLRKTGIVSNETIVSTHHIIMNPAYVHITQKSISDVTHKKIMLEKSGIYSF